MDRIPIEMARHMPYKTTGICCHQGRANKLTGGKPESYAYNSRLKRWMPRANTEKMIVNAITVNTLLKKYVTRAQPSIMPFSWV